MVCARSHDADIYGGASVLVGIAVIAIFAVATGCTFYVRPFPVRLQKHQHTHAARPLVELLLLLRSLGFPLESPLHELGCVKPLLYRGVDALLL